VVPGPSPISKYFNITGPPAAWGDEKLWLDYRDLCMHPTSKPWVNFLSIQARSGNGRHNHEHGIEVIPHSTVKEQKHVLSYTVAVLVVLKEHSYSSTTVFSSLYFILSPNASGEHQMEGCLLTDWADTSCPAMPPSSWGSFTHPPNAYDSPQTTPND
jgi:hypothetical protein